MHPQTLAVTFGCLTQGLDVPWNVPSEAARLVRLADKLTGWDGSTVSRPLRPIFTHMNGEHQTAGHSADCGSILVAIRKGCSEMEPNEEWLPQLLTLLEDQAGSLPADEDDIPLFDRLKITAAVGAALSEYALQNSLPEDDEEFRREKSFLLYSADLSGIQSFIYTVATDKTVRSLRSRSFFLGLAMEHYVDELLRVCGLSRANLLYSGGGHCYLLLPNTSQVTTAIEGYNFLFNDFLLDEFGASLYLAHGWTECCGNDLINSPAKEFPYKAMFRRASSMVSARKLHRYSPDQILRLNNQKEGGERECKICGRSDKLIDDRCQWCQHFVELSNKIQHQDLYLVSSESIGQPDFSLPAADGTKVYFTFTDEKTARTRMNSGEAVIRVYAKNRNFACLHCCTRLRTGDYALSNLMKELADEAEGIRRIAVCRMDVDNLGQAFVAGFERSDDPDPVRRCRYVSLARTAAFSRQMSVFFQENINGILSGEATKEKKLSVAIVYSGGDDVFLIGAWNDVLEAALRIQQKFEQFTCGALSLSGGIGIFDEHYPLRAAAERTADLEDRAKSESGKNAVSLFDHEADHTYSWKTFRDKVYGEKLATLQQFFTTVPERGNSFLYRLMNLLRQAQESEGKINLARYAYLLARLEPKKSDPNWKEYRIFADRMYSWALSQKDRAQLITAIYLYVYLNRRT